MEFAWARLDRWGLGVALLHLLHNFGDFLNGDALLAIKVAFADGKFFRDLPNFHALDDLEFKNIIQYPFRRGERSCTIGAETLDRVGEHRPKRTGGVLVVIVERGAHDIELQ